MSLLVRVEQLPFDDIVRFEVRRHGGIVGLDSADVLQEMRALVHTTCVPRLDATTTGRTYVRRSVRNALATLHRNATTAARQPKDARGRGVLTEVYEESEAPSASPEALAEIAELGRMLQKIPKSDREVLASAFLDGVRRVTASEVEAARQRAEVLLTKLLTGDETMVKKLRAEVPECHAEGVDPIGYETDPNEAQQCQDCTDKFTCLPAGIRSGLLKGVDLRIDPEVLAGYRGIIPVDDLRKRLAERTKLRDKDKGIPETLAYNNIPGVMDALAKADASIKALVAPTTVDEDDEDEKEEMTMEKKTKKVEKEKPAKGKPEKAPKAPKAKAEKKARSKGEAPANRLGEKGSFRYAGKPKTLEDGSIELPNGRSIPAPQEITPEKMEVALARLNGKLGLDFDLAVGMTLTQHRRGSDDIVIKIKKNGFSHDGKTYASLSTACMAALVRSVSAVEMFNFEKHSNIEVSGPGVPGGSYAKAKAEKADDEKPVKKAKAEKPKKKADDDNDEKPVKKAKAEKPKKKSALATEATLAAFYVSGPGVPGGSYAKAKAEKADDEKPVKKAKAEKPKKKADDDNDEKPVKKAKAEKPKKKAKAAPPPVEEEEEAEEEVEDDDAE